MIIKVGQGCDVHRLVEGETLWLGGIRIPHSKGTVAHSDGDVLIHAICDALLGAARKGNIGILFPDTSKNFKNIDSKILLRETYRLVLEDGFEIINIDSTVCAQKPELNPFVMEMERVMSGVLGIDPGQISVKATTTEKLGFEGREEGISAIAVVLIQKKD